MKRRIIIEIICSLLIFLFMYTAISKLLEYHSFKNVLNKSPLLSSFSGIIAIALPIGEIIVATLLFFRRTQLTGLWASFGLLSLFTIYLTYMVMFAEKLPCSCGGVISQMTWKQHIAFNVLFVLLSFTAIHFTRKLNKQEEPPVVVFT